MIKKLDELTIEEVRSVAESYGLEVGDQNRAALRKMLRDSTDIDPDNVHVPEVKEKVKPKYHGRRRVVFPNQEGPGGTDDITIGVNGYRYQIKREQVVELPPEALSVIDDAVIEEVYRDENDVYVTRKRKRFIYQFA